MNVIKCSISVYSSIELTRSVSPGLLENLIAVSEQFS